MTRDSGFIDFLEEYLDEHEGQTPLSDDARSAIRAELPSIRQRPAWWPGWRSPEMNTTAKFVLGVAAAALTAAVGFTMLNGGGNVGGPDPSTPDPTSSSSPSPVAALAGQPDLVAGRYAIASGISMQVTAMVPNGWSAMDRWAVRGPLGYEGPAGMGLRFYTVGNLFNNPGSRADGLQDPPVGPSVDDLIDAIVAQAEWTTSTPSETTIGGFSAKHVRITIPDGAEFDPSTDGGAFFLFQDEGSGQIWGLDVGQMFDVYVVDVDGERLVLDAYHYPGTSSADLAALDAVVNSIQIVPAP
jgi:hypothetical protein